MVDRCLSRGGTSGSGTARIIPHTVLGGYLTSEASTATTVARHCITGKADYAGIAQARPAGCNK